MSWRTATAEITANSGVPPWLNASALDGEQRTDASARVERDWPATIAVTRSSSIERLAAAGVGQPVTKVKLLVTLKDHLAEASCRDRRRPARSAPCRAAHPVISAVRRRSRGCPPVTQATDPVVTQRNAPGLVVRPRSRRRLPPRSAGMRRQGRSPRPSRGGPLLQASHRAGQCRPGSSTRSDTTSAPAVAPDRRTQPQARPHAADAAVATRCGQAGNQGGMPSARQHREV